MNPQNVLQNQDNVKSGMFLSKSYARFEGSQVSFQELFHAVHYKIPNLNNDWFNAMYKKWITRYEKCIACMGVVIDC